MVLENLSLSALLFSQPFRPSTSIPLIVICSVFFNAVPKWCTTESLKIPPPVMWEPEKKRSKEHHVTARASHKHLNDNKAK
jgi:hypothetical protein